MTNIFQKSGSLPLPKQCITRLSIGTKSSDVVIHLLALLLFQVKTSGTSCKLNLQHLVNSISSNQSKCFCVYSYSSAHMQLGYNNKLHAKKCRFALPALQVGQRLPGLEILLLCVSCWGSLGKFLLMSMWTQNISKEDILFVSKQKKEEYHNQYPYTRHNFLKPESMHVYIGFNYFDATRKDCFVG